jgi:hypothetical protein
MAVTRTAVERTHSRLPLDEWFSGTQREPSVHIDAASGHVISIMDTSRRVHRWLVDGPHIFDFPLLNRAGPLWHGLLLLGTAAGFLFSCTGVVPGFRRLGQSLS